MKQICVIGSINKDIVFNVVDFVKPKETIQSVSMEEFLGGKGLNQAIALNKAYDYIKLCGNINHQDSYILEQVKGHLGNTELVNLSNEKTGTAFIQVNQEGENCIILEKGANHSFTTTQIDDVLKTLFAGDLIVLQNEINLLDYIIEQASLKGIKTALNPSPMDASISNLPLSKIDYLLVNEVEAQELTRTSTLNKTISELQTKFNNTCVVLTLGEHGSYCFNQGEQYFQPSESVISVDTTAAGDTFTGFFLGSIMLGKSIMESLQRASAAAGISVTRKGASDSIPSIDELKEYLLTHAQ